MSLSAKVKHDLHQVVLPCGRLDCTGGFTLDPDGIATSIRPLLLKKPHLLVATFVRLLHHLCPTELRIACHGCTFSLEAAGPFAGHPTSKPTDVERGQPNGAYAALELLLLLLSNSNYDDTGITCSTADECWRLASGKDLVRLQSRGPARLILWLKRSGGRWHAEQGYLKAISGFCLYPVRFQDQTQTGLRPLGAYCDLYLKVTPGEKGDFAFAGATPTMLRSRWGVMQPEGDESPLTAIREVAEDSSNPTLVRLGSEVGTVGLRFLTRGILTDPITLRTRGRARGEVIIKDDDLKTDFTGLSVLCDQVPESLLSDATRRAEAAWVTVNLAYHEGKRRSPSTTRDFFRSDAGRVMASFIGLAIWMALSIPILIQPFFMMPSSSLRILVAPLLLIALFGPPLGILLHTMKNLGKYRAGEDPYVWIYHRWDELSR